MKKLSIIIPTYNEVTSTDYFGEILREIGSEPQFEVIVVDGGSTDDTLLFAQQFPSVTAYSIDSKFRAPKLNLGIEKATTNLIFLHHPKSFVSRKDLLSLVETSPDYWGGFTHKFDTAHPLLSFTSWYSNSIRGRGWSPASFLKPIIYLDHGVFFPRKYVIRVFPLPNIAIFEDTVLSQRLNNFFGKGVILPFITKVSAIRFTASGLYRRALFNQVAKIRWYCNRSDKVINDYYQATK